MDGMQTSWTLRLVFAGWVCALMLVVGCRPKRPYGIERLGPVAEFLKPETYLERNQLLVRYDRGGLSAMSTLCTKDLSPLVMERVGSKCELVSPLNGSRYDCIGRVLNGPAKHNLPYYELLLAPGEYEQRVADTLYVWIGKEKPPTWRLKIR